MPQFATEISGPVAVIGDVHGQLSKLEAVLTKLRGRRDFQDRWIVFIGDFVDRGPDTNGCIEAALRLQKEHPKTTAVAGNHELAMGGALGWFPVPDYVNWPDQWLAGYDSEQTFRSYGLQHGNLDELNDRIPAAHREFVTNLPWLVEHPEFLFVHAGLDPHQPTELQRRILQQKDFTLNRPPWLCSKGLVEAEAPPDCHQTIVSGHVRVSEVKIKRQRILIDTTGGVSGDLSCVLLPERVVISSGDGAAHSLRQQPEQPKLSWWRRVLG